MAENNSDLIAPESEQLIQAAEFLKTNLKTIPQLAVVLGSGLGFFAEQIAVTAKIASQSIPHFPQPTVAGHGGQLVLGHVAQVPLIAIQGRVHMYEGRSLAEVTFYVHLLARLGVRFLILTNAAGSVSPAIKPGDFVLLTDYLSFTQIPLPNSSSPHYSPFSPRLISLAQEVAAHQRIPLKTGIYTWTLGPSYETPAEVQAIRRLGAQVVGMSTVPEAVVAAQLGLEVMAMSLVTNLAAGVGTSPITHDEVQATAEQSKKLYSRLMLAIVTAIGAFLTQDKLEQENSRNLKNE